MVDVNGAVVPEKEARADATANKNGESTGAQGAPPPQASGQQVWFPTGETRPAGQKDTGAGISNGRRVQLTLPVPILHRDVMGELVSLQIHPGGPSAKESQQTINADLPIKRRGRCKWFNVAKGWGFITPLDGSQDVFVHQSVIKMTGFRSLNDDEEVEFMCKATGKGFEATHVSGIGDSECRGSTRRPVSKKKFRKIRCYNCGEYANHIAAKCNLEPQPKRCHICKSESHLLADCPLRRNSEQEGNADNGTKNGSVGEKDVNDKTAK